MTEELKQKHILRLSNILALQALDFVGEMEKFLIEETIERLSKEIKYLEERM